jgi:hypothetical protein
MMKNTGKEKAFLLTLWTTLTPPATNSPVFYPLSPVPSPDPLPTPPASLIIEHEESYQTFFTEFFPPDQTKYFGGKLPDGSFLAAVHVSTGRDLYRTLILTKQVLFSFI